jgi:type I restriction enzyme, S subunit
VTPDAFVAAFEVLAEAPGGVKELRRMVLDLAMWGKLVPQDPKDEPAVVLLERIATERALLIKQGVLKVTAPGPPAEDLGELPPSWEWASFGSVIVFGPKNGYSPRAVDRPTGVKSLTLSATTSGTFDGKHAKYIDEPIEPESTLWLRDGDILIQRGNTIDYVGVAAIYRGAGHEFIYPDLMMKVRASSRLVLEYVHLALNSRTARNFITARASGTSGSMPKINQSVVEAMPIAIPPANEQQRIVKRVAQLTRLCDDLEARQAKKRETAVRLNRAALDALTTAEGPEEVATSFRRVVRNLEVLADKPESVAKLRDTILDLAVQGRLVPADGGDGSLNDAEVAEAMGGNFFPEMALPARWTWERLGAICRFIDYRGRTPVKTSTGTRLITAKNVRMGYLREAPLEYIADEDYDGWMTRGIPEHGDLLFTTEAPLGNVAQLLTTERVALAQRIITLHPVTSLHSAYLKVALISPLLQQAIRNNATGTTAQGIKAAKLKLIHVPLPPLAEQKRIVAKVDQLMALCDSLEAALRRAESTAQKLAEAVVAEIVA